MVGEANVFLVVQEYDAKKDEKGNIVNIVQMKSDVDSLEKFFKAVFVEMSALEKQYPLTMYTITQYHTDDLSEVGEISYKHRLEDYKPLVVNASTVDE